MSAPVPSWLDRSAIAERPGPPVEQICMSIRHAIAVKDAGEGESLPPIRALADHLGVAVNTVAKAYKRLESEGLLVGRGRGGTVVAKTQASRAGVKTPQEAAALFVQRARAQGLCEEEALELVHQAWERQCAN